MIKTADRDGNIILENSAQDRFLAYMYGHMLGRILLKPLVSPGFSHLSGKMLSCRASSLLINPFVRARHIDLSQCREKKFHSFNEFFTRKLQPGARRIESDPDCLISPCDGRVCVYEINDSCSFEIKNTKYTLGSLLKNKKLAHVFKDGYAWVFRLEADDYHRYIYVDQGAKSSNYRIPGIFHTVNPVANDCYPVYKENTREYSLLRSENFGTLLMMEVGAMMVGKIENHHGACSVRRGQEKGNFAFGGSTIILLTMEGRIQPDRDILKNSRHGIETRVLLGEQIARKNR